MLFRSLIINCSEGGSVKRERNGQPINACLYPYHSCFSLIFVFFFFSLLFFLGLSLFLAVVVPLPPPHPFTVHNYYLYTIGHGRIYHFLPFNHFWLAVGALPRLHTGLSTAQPLPLHCIGYTMSHSQTKMTCLVSYRSLFSLFSLG